MEPLPVPPLDVAQGHSAMLFAPTPSAAGEVKADGATYPCPACHGPNGADRTFCQPCGAPMRPAPEPVPPTRLQRLRAVRRRRPDVWHWDRRWGVAVAALPLCLCVGVSAGAAAAAAQHAFPLVEDRFGAQYAVAPDSVSASSAAKGFEAAYASDGVDNKAWAPKGSGEDAVGQEWTAAFGTPFRLTTLLIVNGASTSPGQFFESGRPTKISVRVDTADGSTVEKDVTLGARPGPQRFDLGIDKVTRVSLVLRSTNPGLTARAPVAMAEIQFFTRKSA
ncbi:discoidin domain-containing protein [Streptomyces sp. NPDC092307]|uniref:discoidin domain-containing protein n=1 Tax=Streptomyces sp. NPDC092307 TaxID=3366013 RepID=UPI0038250764